MNKVTLTNVYGPNHDDPAFFNDPVLKPMSCWQQLQFGNRSSPLTIRSHVITVDGRGTGVQQDQTQLSFPTS